MMFLHLITSSRNILQSRCHHFLKLFNSFTPIKIIQTPKLFYMSHQLATNELLDEQDRNYFDSVYPEIVKSLTNEYVQPTSDIKLPASRLIEVLNYNVPGGKKIRGQFVVKSARTFASPKKLSDEDFHLACVLGWLIEMIQAFYLMLDDIYDQSETRRGVPCWYRKEGVGLVAINDAHCIEASTYMLLKTYFGKKPYYTNLNEIFRQVTFQTGVGEILDLHWSKPAKNLDFSNLNSDTYFLLTKYKTSLYYVYLPIVLGMTMVGITDETIYKTVEEFALKLGHFAQVQNDHLDCYGDSTITGKHGSDIENGRFTWLLVKALELGNPEQKAIISQNYGVDDSNCVAKVKAVYDELQLSKLFKKYEEDEYQEIIKLIGDFNIHYSTDLFIDYVNILNKRKS